MSGFDVLARLQARHSQRRFVVIMSAASRDVIVNIGSGNVFAALRKPFEIDEMIATVRACIAAPQRS